MRSGTICAPGSSEGGQNGSHPTARSSKTIGRSAHACGGATPVTFRFMIVTMASLALASGSAHAAPPIAPQNFDCVIEARQTVKLSSSALGMVGELNVDRGDVVRKGQLLGKLDDGVEAANLELARAKAVNDYEITGHKVRLNFLREKFGRADQLVGSKIVSKNTRDEAFSDMQVEEQQLRLSELQHAEAQLEARQAEAVVRQRQIVSPVNGVVVERLLSVGEYRNDQSAIMTIAEIDPLRVEVFVPTIYYGQIAVGDVGHVHPEEPIGGEHDAAVTVVDKVMDAASGTFGVRLELPNPDLALPAGLKCKIRFDGAARAGTPAPKG
jgi:RND family efflux transporter MFP subunit